MKNLISRIKTFLQGTIIGIANIIPGVSGGTMALLLGIYERFISALHNISFQTLKSFFSLFKFSKESYQNFCTEMKRIDALFLSMIGLGAISAIVALAKIMKILLIKFHDPTYGFFFGLVLASAIVPYKIIKIKSSSVFAAILIGFLLIISLSFVQTDQEKLSNAQKKCEIKKVKSANTASSSITVKIDTTQAILIFLAGFISISAMILPGISGAFMLLLMGQYFALLKALNDRNIAIIGFFMLGAIMGLLIFTRFLNWILAKYHDKTMGFLIGLIIGSLWILWPFKNYSIVCNNRIDLSNILPSGFTLNEAFTIFTIMIGVLIVAAMIQTEKRLASKS